MMMSSDRLPFPLDLVLDPEAEGNAVAAFNEAWSALQSEGIVFSRHADEVETRELLARRIAKSARKGERSREKLRDAALFGLTKATIGVSPRFK
jgi:hypothetical protein